MSQGNGVVNGHGADSVIGSFKVKAGLAQMLKGGVIMDVVNAEQVSHSIKSYIRIFQSRTIALPFEELLIVRLIG